MGFIETIIDDNISKKHRAKDNSKFRVSDSGRCHLMRFWKRQGKEFSDEVDRRTRRVFEVGHIFHEWLQEGLLKAGVLVEKEFKVEDIHRAGHADAIVMTEQGLVLYDFKTVHSKKFHYLGKSSGDTH